MRAGSDGFSYPSRSFLPALAITQSSAEHRYAARTPSDPARAEPVSTVTRIVHLGFEIRVELVLKADDKHVWAQLTKEKLDDLALEEGQTCFMRPRQQRSFNGSTEPETAEERLAAEERLTAS